MPSSEKTYIYRITHCRNLPWILDHGLHCRSSRRQDPDFINIGNVELIDKRAKRAVPVAPGGHLNDYVPFYFCKHSVMLYNIHTGRVEGVDIRQEEVVYLVSTIERLEAQEIPFLFTSRHAYVANAKFFSDRAKLKVLDWPLIKGRDFFARPRRPRQAGAPGRGVPDSPPASRARPARNCVLRPKAPRLCSTTGGQTRALPARKNPPGLVFLMIHYLQGNLLEAQADALVNTVNTVGVMGKGIALQFKEAFPENYAAYAAACKAGGVRIGEMFVTETHLLQPPRFIINFPTKKDWKHPSKLDYVTRGLADLVRVIREREIRSVALPPLGCGNGGLDWALVKPAIETALRELDSVDCFVFEPTTQYLNAPKRAGVEELTPARAMLVEVVRSYCVLGFECTNLELQKLAYFLQRFVEALKLPNPLKLNFQPNKYGPYADNLRHALDALDGSYLHCEKRLADAGPLEPITVDFGRVKNVTSYLAAADGAPFQPALSQTETLIDGFQSPYLMELLSTVDWIQAQRPAQRFTAAEATAAIAAWPGGNGASARKRKIFPEDAVAVALDRLHEHAELLYA